MKNFDEVLDKGLYELKKDNNYIRVYTGKLELDTTLDKLLEIVPINVLKSLVNCNNNMPHAISYDLFRNTTINDVMQCNIYDVMNYKGMGSYVFYELIRYMIPICYNVLDKWLSSTLVPLDTSLINIPEFKELIPSGLSSLDDLLNISFFDYKNGTITKEDGSLFKDKEWMIYYSNISKLVHSLGYYMKDDFGGIILDNFIRDWKKKIASLDKEDSKDKNNIHESFVNKKIDILENEMSINANLKNNIILLTRKYLLLDRENDRVKRELEVAVEKANNSLNSPRRSRK